VNGPTSNAYENLVSADWPVAARRPTFGGALSLRPINWKLRLSALMDQRILSRGGAPAAALSAASSLTFAAIAERYSFTLQVTPGRIRAHHQPYLLAAEDSSKKRSAGGGDDCSEDKDEDEDVEVGCVGSPLPRAFEPAAGASSSGIISLDAALSAVGAHDVSAGAMLLRATTSGLGLQGDDAAAAGGGVPLPLPPAGWSTALKVEVLLRRKADGRVARFHSQVAANFVPLPSLHRGCPLRQSAPRVLAAAQAAARAYLVPLDSVAAEVPASVNKHSASGLDFFDTAMDVAVDSLPARAQGARKTASGVPGGGDGGEGAVLREISLAFLRQDGSASCHNDPLDPCTLAFVLRNLEWA